MKRILVIGESCRDIFVYCNAERLSPEMPVPVLGVVDTTENPGMAMNVFRNMKSIGCSCDITTNTGWQKVTKTRYMHLASNHMFVRVDTDHRIPRADVKKIPLSKYDIIAISDYHKGFLTEEDIKYICQHHDTVFMDTKKVLGPWAMGAKYIKINNYEYERSKSTISKRLQQKIICTQGERGCVFAGKNYPVQRVEVRDIAGAGDSFFAALVCKYAECGAIEEAIKFANFCASKVVQHRGVSVVPRGISK